MTNRWGRTRRAALAGLLATALAAGATACSSDASSRSGALVGTTAPTVSCSVGVGGVLSISNIAADIASAAISWNYYLDPNGKVRVEGLGLRDPNNPNSTPPPDLQISSMPWSSTKSSASPTVTVLFTAANASFVTNTYSCTKTGTDSPTPVISCSHTGPGEVGEHGTVYVKKTEIEGLGSDASKLLTTWWFKGVQIWKVVLNPIITAIPATWSDIAPAESKSYDLPGSDAPAKTGYKYFDGTKDLPIPSDFAGAYIGHVRVIMANDQFRPVSFPAEVDC